MALLASKLIKRYDCTIVTLFKDKDIYVNINKKIDLINIYNRRVKLKEVILRYVDLVIPKNNWKQKEQDIKEYHIDIFAMGDDWKGNFDFLKKYCEVVYLSRTPEISTTQIKFDLEMRINL